MYLHCYRRISTRDTTLWHPHSILLFGDNYDDDDGDDDDDDRWNLIPYWNWIAMTSTLRVVLGITQLDVLLCIKLRLWFKTSWSTPWTVTPYVYFTVRMNKGVLFLASCRHWSRSRKILLVWQTQVIGQIEQGWRETDHWHQEILQLPRAMSHLISKCTFPTLYTEKYLGPFSKYCFESR